MAAGTLWWGKSEVENRIPKMLCREHHEAAIRPLDMNISIPGGIRQRAEVKSTLESIDRELGAYRSLPELDFRAGYLAGKIYEKEAAGIITPENRADLLRVLYAKYEVLRNLEREEVRNVIHH